MKIINNARHTKLTFKFSIKSFENKKYIKQHSCTPMVLKKKGCLSTILFRADIKIKKGYYKIYFD